MDYVVSSAQALVQTNSVQALGSDFALIGGDSSPANPDTDKAINIKKLGPNWVNLSQEYSDKSFVLSFIQMNTSAKAMSRIKSSFRSRLETFHTNSL